MSPEAIKLRLRVLESRKAILAWYEKRPGAFVVVIGPGPAMSIHNGRDVQALEGLLLRRAKAGA